MLAGLVLGRSAELRGEVLELVECGIDADEREFGPDHVEVKLPYVRENGVILASLRPGPVGFADLRRAVGTITDSVLSDRLTELSAEGLVERSITDSRPPGVIYNLTGAGLPILDQLAGWASGNLAPPAGQPVQQHRG